MARPKKELTLEEFKTKIEASRLKTKAYTLCALWDELGTPEGMAKREIIMKSLRSDELNKFNEYTKFFRHLLDTYPVLLVYQERKKRAEVMLHSILSHLWQFAEQTARTNTSIKKAPPSQQYIDTLVSLLTAVQPDRVYPFTRGFNKDKNTFYIIPNDIWERLEANKKLYINTISEAKPFLIALDEYLKKYSFKPENLTSNIKEAIKDITSNNYPKLRFSKETLIKWLRDLENVSSREEFIEWQEEATKFSDPLLYPDYKDIKPSAEGMENCVEYTNYFDIW